MHRAKLKNAFPASTQNFMNHWVFCHLSLGFSYQHLWIYVEHYMRFQKTFQQCIFLKPHWCFHKHVICDRKYMFAFHSTSILSSVTGCASASGLQPAQHQARQSALPHGIGQAGLQLNKIEKFSSRVFWRLKTPRFCCVFLETKISDRSRRHLNLAPPPREVGISS